MNPEPETGLLPCPFCGGDYAEVYQETPSAYCRVICNHGCPLDAKTKGEAIENWNRRIAPKNIRNLIVEIRQTLRAVVTADKIDSRIRHWSRSSIKSLEQLQSLYNASLSQHSGSLTTPQGRPSAETGLLPCPFCGSRNLHVYHGHGGNKVKCFDCYISGVFEKDWNKRVPLISSPCSRPKVEGENQNPSASEDT